MLVDMIDKVRELVKTYLDEGKVDGVLAMRRENGHVGPHLFVKGDDIETLELEPKYSLAGIAAIAHSSGVDRIAIIGRGCDERTLIELAKRNQVDLDRIDFIGIACTSEEAEECECDRPYPEKMTFGERVEGVEPAQLRNLSEMSLDERLDFWREQFSKCFKCYGCKEACPMCMCAECVLEDGDWVKKGELPPPFPIFHLIRAFHMSDRCVHCLECEDACPMGIPLTLLYRQLREDMKELFDYLPGIRSDERTPLATTLEDEKLEDEA